VGHVFVKCLTVTFSVGLPAKINNAVPASQVRFQQFRVIERFCVQGRIQEGDWAIVPAKTCEISFIHHDFVLFGKQHSRYKAILSSIVLSQEWCEVYFISLTAVNL